MKHSSLVFILFSLLLVFPQDIFASNLLLNPSFEEVSNGMPNNWIKNVTTVTVSLAQGVTGSMAASIIKTNNTTGTIYVYQDVDVEPETFYRLSGLVQKNSTNFSWALLRISWRNITNEVSKTDSEQVTIDSTEFKTVRIDAVQVPSLSTKARIELVGNIILPNPTSPILFDNIEFLQIPPPEQPTVVLPTATQIPANTPTPTSAIKASTTPFPKIPSLKPLPTFSPIPSMPESDDASEASLPSVLSETTISETISPFPSVTVIPLKNISKKTKSSYFYPALFLIAGGLFTISCGILTIRLWREKHE